MDARHSAIPSTAIFVLKVKRKRRAEQREIMKMSIEWVASRGGVLMDEK